LTDYDGYIKYSLVVNLLKNEHTARELVILSQLTAPTLYRIVKVLLEKDVIKVVRYNMNAGRKERVFKIK